MRRSIVSGSAMNLYPMEIFFGILRSEKEVIEIPKRTPFCGEWGQPLSNHVIYEDKILTPAKIDMVYASFVERKFYSIESVLPVETIECHWRKTDENDNESLFESFVVGMAPFGGTAIWMQGYRKEILIAWLKAEEIEVDMKDFMPMNPDITFNEVCDFYINRDQCIRENFANNGLPPCNLFDKYMQQFNYRYLLLFEKWDESGYLWHKYGDDDMLPMFEYIEEALYDGTHDKLHDDSLMKYHEAGKPKKLRIQWHIGKSEYSAYFWFEDERIRDVFDKFYGAHPDTKTDFIIRIDAEQRKYELALYRYGLKEPQIIPEDVYQLLVFKNKFEDYRSDNYNQERGAWIW